jgi:hypothetical protein
MRGLEMQEIKCARKVGAAAHQNCYKLNLKTQREKKLKFPSAPFHYFTVSKAHCICKSNY